MTAIANLLMSARKRAGRTQRQLSLAADIPQASISLIERGLISPRTTTVERWLEACDATLRLTTRDQGVASRQPRALVPPARANVIA